MKVKLPLNNIDEKRTTIIKEYFTTKVKAACQFYEKFRRYKKGENFLGYQSNNR